MYRVETHNNSKEYFNNVNIETDALYVMPTTSLAFVLKENGRTRKEDFEKIIDIDNLINAAYKKSSDLLNGIKLKTEVRSIISKLKDTISNENILRELSYLEDNIKVLMSDIIYLIQINLKSFNYKVDNITKKTFKLIYDELLKTEIYKEIEGEILNFNILDSFQGEFNKDIIKKIYFYNINNLDLKRWLVIEKIKENGFEVIFRIPYFQWLEVTNKVWDRVYGNKNIFSWSISNIYTSNNDINSKYTRYLEGDYDTLITKDEKVITKTYAEVSDLRKVLKDKSVVTFYKDSLGPCKDTIIYEKENGINEELNKIDHCYQTSLGRFLFHLYSVKIKNNTVELDFNLYRELITSGWIETKGWNGIRLSEYLSKNDEYFSGVSNIDDIINRLNILKDLEAVNDIFEEPVKNYLKNDNKKKALINPLRVFGYNNLQDYGITASYMITLTLRLKTLILKSLENNNGLINIEKHFELLKSAFRNQTIIEKSKSGSEIEKLLVRKIWAVLNNSKDFPINMYQEDIAEWLNVVLKVNINDDKNREEKDFSIDHLEGLIFRDKRVNYNGKKIIYISDLSYLAYEKYIKNKYILDKCLTKEDFKDIFNESFSGAYKEKILTGFNLNYISIASTEAYLKFIFANLFINFDGVKEISWIDSFRENDSKSIIFKQIESIYDNNEETYQGLDISEIIVEEDIIIDKYIDYDKNELSKSNIKYPEVAYRDLDFCSNKFLYTSVLNFYPMYYSSFHNKLGFSALISILKNSIDDSYLNISKFIFPLFPQWEDVVKQNILTCEYGRKNIRDYKYFDGINYPKTIDSLYLLKSKYVVSENWKIKNRYNKGNFKQEDFYKDFLNKYLKDDTYNNGNHCSMCPHIFLCKKGEFVIDRK